MKTMTPKNAVKLFLFLLILFSAKAFSHPKLPNGGGSSDCETRMGYSVASKREANPSKNTTAMRSNATSKVRLKASISK